MNNLLLNDLNLTLDPEVPSDFIAGIIYIRNSSEGEYDRLKKICDDWFEQWKASGYSADERVKTEIRTLLRARGYTPSGRGKPASEYLLRWFQEEDKFVNISPAVDVNNIISVKYLLPASILDVELLDSKNLTIRIGQTDESYIFNNSGQEINLKGLVLVADSAPAGNPIKDSMRAKLTSSSTNLIAVIYSSLKAYNLDSMNSITAEFADLLFLALKPTEVYWNLLYMS